MRIARWSSISLLLVAVVSLVASCQPRTPDAGSAGTAAVADSVRPAPPSPDSLRKLAAIVRGSKAFLAYCAMCHGDGGNGDGETAVAFHRKGANIARLNDPDRMEKLTRDQVRKVIMDGGAHTGRSNLMPAWGEKLGPGIVSDITEYVLTLQNDNPAIPKSTIGHYLEAPPGVPADGRRIFVHYCVVCHGEQGKGDGTFAERLFTERKVRPRNLTDSTYLGKLSDERIFAVVSLGGGHFKKSNYMPEWNGQLSPAQIKSVIAYVREISGTRHQEP